MPVRKQSGYGIANGHRTNFLLGELMSKVLDKAGLEPGSAVAVVDLRVRVKVGAWGSDCTIDQAISQATSEASHTLKRLLKNDTNCVVLSAEYVSVQIPSKKAQ